MRSDKRLRQLAKKNLPSEIKKVKSEKSENPLGQDVNVNGNTKTAPAEEKKKEEAEEEEKKKQKKNDSGSSSSSSSSSTFVNQLQLRRRGCGRGVGGKRIMFNAASTGVVQCHVSGYELT